MAHLAFKGRVFVENFHLGVPYHELKAVKSKGLSKKPSIHDNLIIEGDNLAALKALLPFYHGKVKCIYIDPPYNTGNENWAYNDRVNSPMMKDWLGKTVDRDDLTRHDKWCCMMLPRLKLLRELLREDGVIFVSIDDNEIHHLRCVMDDVFGADNFIGTFVWEGTGKNDAHFVSVGHDYILCYAKRLEKLRTNRSRWRVIKNGSDRVFEMAAEFVRKRSDDFAAASNDLKSWFASLPKNDPVRAHRHYNWIDETGVYFAGDISWPGGGGPTYQVLHPRTRRPVKVPARGWVFPNKERMNEALAEARVHFGLDETRVPNLKRYLHETDHQVLTSVFYQDRRAAHKELVRLLPDAPLQYPKDMRVLRRLFEAVTADEDIILDSFAGSGATAHAVLSLNAQDNSRRRFVLVECESYVDTMTAERVRRVIKDVSKVKGEHLKNRKRDTFSYFRLGKPMRKEAMLHPSKLPTYERLAAYVFFTATGEEFDPAAMRPKRWFIGRTRSQDVFLIYTDDFEELKDLALTRDIARRLSRGKRPKLVFAPTKYLDEETMHALGVTFQQLPYEIYETVDSLSP